MDAADHVSRLRLAILLVLGAAASLLLAFLLFPFLPALVTSAVLATLTYPAHVRVRRRIRQADVAALVSTTAVFFLVLVPTVALSIVLIDQVRQGIEWLSGVVTNATAPGGLVSRGLDYAARRLGIEAAEVTAPVTEELSGLLGLLARRTFSFLSGLGGWLLQAAAALFTLFYFLRDGEGFMETVKWLVPLDAASTDRLVDKTRDVIYATVFGNVVVAAVQGTLGGLAFWVLGLPAAALWGSAMGVLSLLPVVGPTFVWGPAGIILLAEGEILRGIALLAFGAAVISTVDNYLRAVLIGGRTHLHSLIVFFSVLAGLFAFGAVGIFVGPVLFVIAFSVLEIARSALDVAEAARAPGARPPGRAAASMFAAGAPEPEAGPRDGEPAAERVREPRVEAGARSGAEGAAREPDSPARRVSRPER